MTRRPSQPSALPAQDDLARFFAEGCASAVIEEFLPGIRREDKAEAMARLMYMPRLYRDDKPESSWIYVRSRFPAMPEWDAAPEKVRRAITVFHGVLKVMDRGLKEPPPPAPKPPEPAPPRLERMENGLRPGLTKNTW